MTRQRWIIWIIVSLLVIPTVYPQGGKGADAARKKEKIEREQKKAYEIARKKTLKHRREIQTEATRKRMDEADKRANAYNRQHDDRWWEKIIKGAKRKKR